MSVSKMIDHALLHPTLTDADLEAGCRLAIRYDVASVCIKPYAVKKAAEWLAGTSVLVCTVIGFPHGSNTIPVKVAETIQACKEGATEIDMVVNVGKVLSEDWAYIQAEIQAIQEACLSHGALLKVIFENDFLPQDSYKIKLCEICTEIGVAFVKTSTGFGYVKNATGTFESQGATEHDLRLMLAHIGPNMAVKASGGIKTLAQVLTLKEMGVQRIGTSSTESILNE